MDTRHFMKRVNNDNSTNVYEHFKNHDYLEFHARYYFDLPSLTLHFCMYGYGYAWNLRNLGRVLNVSFKGMLFFTKSTDTKAVMKRIPSKSWEKPQLHPHLKAWADVLVANMFIEIEAYESFPIIVGHMFYCIKTNTPFNFSHFIARRLSGLDYNNETLPYARVMTTLFEYLKNKHLNDAS
ncbi:hypothetical protein Tco_1426168 [Tanacetum coccineum]